MIPPALWVLFAVTFPYLVASYAFDKVIILRGPEAFKNPGGWKFPLGEVVIFGAAFAALAFVALIDYTVNGI